MSTLENTDNKMDLTAKTPIKIYGFNATSKSRLKSFAATEGYNSVSEFVADILFERLDVCVLDSQKKPLSLDTKGRFRFQIRLSSSDGEALLKQLKLLGYNSPARYAKSILLNHIKKTTVSPISIEQRNVLHESNAKLERIGRNINQIARQYNTDPYLAKDILTVDRLAALSKMIENHCTVVGHLLAENQSVFDK
jgi:hypothetical protein